MLIEGGLGLSDVEYCTRAIAGDEAENRWADDDRCSGGWKWY
jgi:hypothetical protein